MGHDADGLWELSAESVTVLTSFSSLFKAGFPGLTTGNLLREVRATLLSDEGDAVDMGCWAFLLKAFRTIW